MTLFPEVWGILEKETRSIDDTQNGEDIGREVEKENGLEAIGARGLGSVTWTPELCPR